MFAINHFVSKQKVNGVARFFSTKENQTSCGLNMKTIVDGVGEIKKEDSMTLFN